MYVHERQLLLNWMLCSRVRCLMCFHGLWLAYDAECPRFYSVGEQFFISMFLLCYTRVEMELQTRNKHAIRNCHFVIMYFLWPYDYLVLMKIG